MWPKNLHFLLWVFCAYSLVILILSIICYFKIRKAQMQTKTTGIIIYSLLTLQSLLMIVTFGGLSAHEFPWQPSLSSWSWNNIERLHIMLFGIFEFTTVVFNLFPFYLTFILMKEGHTHLLIMDPLVPTSYPAKVLKNLTLLGIFLAYLGGVSYLSYRLMANTLRPENYFFIVFCATICGAAASLFFFILYIFLYSGENMVNSKFKLAFALLIVCNAIWTVCRLYRGIHGIINNNLMLELIREQSDLSVTWRGVVFFFSTLFPYATLVSGLVTPLFFLKHTKNTEYESINQIYSEDVGENSNQG
ncbi:unnamed protein product [Moneuplotes crassus]|uniref:Uncharacterized protein n=1 Tax=Euplotes crassus TaxID=5936 RepID=A0AAD1XNG6_EUPCR|nr:unnamed protein product [Moneuplotes crassus]